MNMGENPTPSNHKHIQLLSSFSVVAASLILLVLFMAQVISALSWRPKISVLSTFSVLDAPLDYHKEHVICEGALTSITFLWVDRTRLNSPGNVNENVSIVKFWSLNPATSLLVSSLTQAIRSASFNPNKMNSSLFNL